jgi:hypothetical protein
MGVFKLLRIDKTFFFARMYPGFRGAGGGVGRRVDALRQGGGSTGGLRLTGHIHDPLSTLWNAGVRNLRTWSVSALFVVKETQLVGTAFWRALKGEIGRSKGLRGSRAPFPWKLAAGAIRGVGTITGITC